MSGRTLNLGSPAAFAPARQVRLGSEVAPGTASTPSASPSASRDSLQLSASPRVQAGGPTAAGMLLGEGSSGPAVTLLQQRLAAAGFNPGATDGQFGPQTLAALKRFQTHAGIATDGVAGPQTWQALEGGAAPRVPAMPAVPVAPSENPSARQRLMSALNNPYRGAIHQCFRYAWATVKRSGGHGIGNANESTAGRWQPITHLSTLIAQGQLREGDVVYANRQPGADPSSTRLTYGPHWFVYLGQNQFADQYGVRSAEAMAQFVPGRKIDTIFHTIA